MYVTPSSFMRLCDCINSRIIFCYRKIAQFLRKLQLCAKILQFLATFYKILMFSY